jgi:hypothetical protein
MTTGQTTQDEEIPQFQRTPGRDIFGPLDDHLPEVRINADVKVDALRRANELGLDLTAFLRENLYASLYGPAHVASLYESRAARALGNARQGDTVELKVVDTMPRRAAA